MTISSAVNLMASALAVTATTTTTITAAAASTATTAASAAAAAAGGSGSNVKKSWPHQHQPPPPLPKRRRMPYLRDTDLHALIGNKYDPSLAENWISVSEDVEFLPLMTKPQKRQQKRQDGDDYDASSTNNARRGTKTRSLEEEFDYEEGGSGSSTGTTSGAYSNYNPYSVQPFVEGMGEYDEYQQAWRLLGFMIECNTIGDDDYQASHHSGDEVTEEGCARYIVWAAYVDLEYEGGGIGEYRYWNRTSESWDDTACYYAKKGSHKSGDNKNDNGNNDDDASKAYNSRCAKMDCHLEDTHFSVLGFFKHRNYDDWMEQLFKHEGMCVWTDEEYAFMKGARKAWPKGCADTGTTVEAVGGDGDSSGSTTLYYNIKPLRNGRIAVGLYTDEQCIVEYPADTDVVESIVGNIFLNSGSHRSNDNSEYDFSEDTFAESMDRWDSAFDVWHMCHPCVAHDLENLGGDKYTDDDDAYYYGDDYYNGRRRRRRGRRLGGEYSAQGDVFECYDDAGYTNVNQCMKFSAKTVMKTATFRDLSSGRHQGTFVEYPLSGYFDASQEYRKQTMANITTYAFLVGASIAFLGSLWGLYKVTMQVRRRGVVLGANSDSPLV